MLSLSDYNLYVRSDRPLSKPDTHLSNSFSTNVVGLKRASLLSEKQKERICSILFSSTFDLALTFSERDKERENDGPAVRFNSLN